MRCTGINSIVILAFLIVNTAFGQHKVDNETNKSIRNARTKTGIVIAGSSITWGKGNLCDSFSGKVLEYILTELSTACMSDQMKYPQNSEKFLNPNQYKGQGRRIDKLNSKVEFDLTGDEIAICQSIMRTSDFGVMQVKADGVVIGRFTNHNPTIGQETQDFTGTGSEVQFLLNHTSTYRHEVKVNGKLLSGKIFDGEYGDGMPGGIDYLIIRKFDQDQKPKHCLWFREAPLNGAKITVNYKFGKVIMFEGSTVGQTTSDEKNESNYGDGGSSAKVSLSYGMEFRYIDKQAFWIHEFTEKKSRHIEIEIVDGVNPYFVINYASNRYHDFMNAGIGGWSLNKVLDHDGINDYENFTSIFQPDVIVCEYATNDDWEFGQRKVWRTLTGLTEKEVKDLWTLELDSISYQKSTDNYSARVCTGLISDIDEFSLSSPQIVGTTIAKGDIIRIGDYHGDNRQVTCREISSVNLAKGQVFWLSPINPKRVLNVGTLSDLKGKECSVRDLSVYQQKYELFIENLRQTAPNAKILITQPGLSNYRLRQLWGYDMIHRKLAAKYPGVVTIEMNARLQEFQESNITVDSFIEIEANGNTEYSLPWQGHWQGFEVWVDNKNVYGKDCYIDGGNGYTVDQTTKGIDLNIKNRYDKSHSAKKPMSLVFTKNIPKKGKIRIIKADSVWSGDYTHPNNYGAYIYGQSYIDRIKYVLH